MRILRNVVMKVYGCSISPSAVGALDILLLRFIID